jgi:hypothetical protein
MKMALTSGFEDFGFGDTEAECIADAINGGFLTAEEISAGIEKYKKSNVAGQGLYFRALDDDE